jgi:hypothetical protein
MTSARWIAALSLVLLLPVAASAVDAVEARWEHIDRQDGIEVYKKETSDSPLVAFKGVAVVEAPLDKVLWVLVDNEHKTEWVDMCSESRVLEQVSPFEFVVYQRFSLPWYLSDRDYVYRGRAVREADGTVRVLLASCRRPDAPETVGVRGELIDSCYVLTPLGPGRTRVSVEIHTDPKGMVPDWLVNLVQRDWPLKTLRGIREQVHKASCGDYPLPPVETTGEAVSAPVDAPR